jgi:hypothetical protein
VILDPGYNVGWANYTNVGQWYEFPPIWKADIAEYDHTIENLTLSYKISFQDTKKRTITRDITYSVK